MADIRTSNRGTNSETDRLLPNNSESAECGGDMTFEETTPVDKWARGITFAGVAILVLSTWVLIISRGPSNLGWFAPHPPLQTLALGVFTYGIMTLQPTCQPETKAAGFARHQRAMLFIGFPIIALGTLSIIYNKILHGAKHATTWHGTLGFTCVYWMLFQIFLGIGSVWSNGALFGGNPKAKAVWKYHRMSGYILFPLMLFTAHLGGGEFQQGTTGFLVYTVAPLLIVIGLVLSIRFSKMKFW